jgi:hypothetical protein
MSKVIHIRVSRLIPHHIIVTLECGHKYLAEHRNPLLRVGETCVCDACLKKEQTIRTITANGATEEITVNLTCGHDQRVKLRTPLNYGNVPDLVGTTIACSICRRLEQGA